MNEVAPVWFTEAMQVLTQEIKDSISKYACRCPGSVMEIEGRLGRIHLAGAITEFQSPDRVETAAAPEANGNGTPAEYRGANESNGHGSNRNNCAHAHT